MAEKENNKFVSVYTKIANFILLLVVLIIVCYVGYWIYNKIYVSSNEQIIIEEQLIPVNTALSPTKIIDNPIPQPPLEIPSSNIKMEVKPIIEPIPNTTIDNVHQSLQQILKKIK